MRFRSGRADAAAKDGRGDDDELDSSQRPDAGKRDDAARWTGAQLGAETVS